MTAISLHPVVSGLGQRPSTAVISPPGEGAGFWAGGPSAVWHDGAVWLAYRLRRPVDAGRGYANVVARSVDGQSFETVAEVTSAQFECASLERPALVRAPDGTWRLYVSCSTAGSKHWWIETLAASSPPRFGSGRGRIVLAGDEGTAWKDPVVEARPAGWRMWACRHAIIPAEEADRMESWYGTSDDGWAWSMHGPALRPTPGTWDARGVRVAGVLPPAAGHEWTALYDGRATASENWEERTGAATGTGPEHLTATGVPVFAPSSIRYASPVALPDGSWLVYYEATRPDGAHDLRVEKVPRPTGFSQSS